MDEKDQKIQEMERELEGLRQEVDTLRRGASPYRYDRRKPLKLWKIILIAAGIIFTLVAAVFIAVFALMNSDKESSAMAEEMLRAIVEQDADRAYALVYPGAMTRDEFDQGFAELCATWRDGAGGDAFTLKRTSWSMNSRGGVTEYASVYEVFSGEARFTLYLDRKAHGETTGITGTLLSR